MTVKNNLKGRSEKHSDRTMEELVLLILLANYYKILKMWFEKQ